VQTDTGSRTDDAVPEDVREAGYRDHRRGIATGKRAGGAQPRHPPGPADQEDEAEEDWGTRGGEYVFAAGVCVGAQRAAPIAGSGGRGVPLTGAEREVVARNLPARERIG